jgi:ribose transport system ATP-binding protein
MMSPDTILLLEQLEKTFPGVKALDGIDLEVKKGEVHALVGENGAGKSTLIKIIAGVYKKDSGRIFFRGEERNFMVPADAYAAGITVIHQETSLIPQLSVLQNVYLGIEPKNKKLRIFDVKEMLRRYREIEGKLGITIDPMVKVRDIGVAEKKLVEIMKALAHSSTLVIMDEPTDSLTEKEIERLFVIIGDLRNKGITLLYITHYLEEVFQISDRVTVLKDGKKIATKNTVDVNRQEIISMMVGKEFHRDIPHTFIGHGKELLRLENFSSTNKFHGISFCAYAGEILGITGVIGSGKSEIARAIFGADAYDSGTLSIEGRQVRIKSPADALANGIGMLPEDRKTLGLIVGQSLLVNVTLSSLRKYTWARIISRKKETNAVKQLVSDLSIKTSSLDQRVQYLSGGNQQKLIIAKWLAANPRIIIMDEPTRGIDIGSKQAIYRIMRTLADSGTCILFISSEIPEITEVSDRILVMKEGKVKHEYRAGVSQEEVMHKVLEEEEKAV